MSDAEHTGPRGRVVWEFSLVALLRAVQVAALLIALVYWFVLNANRGEDNQRRLAELQSDVSAQIAELRQAVATGLGDVRQQLNALPDTARAARPGGAAGWPTSMPATATSTRA